MKYEIKVGDATYKAFAESDERMIKEALDVIDESKHEDMVITRNDVQIYPQPLIDKLIEILQKIKSDGGFIKNMDVSHGWRDSNPYDANYDEDIKTQTPNGEIYISIKAHKHKT